MLRRVPLCAKPDEPCCEDLPQVLKAGGACRGNAEYGVTYTVVALALCARVATS